MIKQINKNKEDISMSQLIEESWPKVSVYDDGWFEWSADPKNPFETGVPEHLNVTR